MQQRPIRHLKRRDHRISFRISGVNRGGSVINKVTILEDLMSLLGHNVRIAKDNSRNSIDKRRYVACSTELSTAHKWSGKPHPTKSIVFRTLCTKVHRGSIEKDDDSMIRSSGRNQTDTVSGKSVGRVIAKKKFIRQWEGLRNRKDKGEFGPDFGSNLKGNCFIRSKTRNR